MSADEYPKSGKPVTGREVREHLKRLAAESQAEELMLKINAVLNAVANSELSDTIGEMKVDIPKDGYSRQNVRNVARELLCGKTEP